jgi:hypothetical protein
MQNKLKILPSVPAYGNAELRLLTRDNGHVIVVALNVETVAGAWDLEKHLKESFTETPLRHCITGLSIGHDTALTVVMEVSIGGIHFPVVDCNSTDEEILAVIDKQFTAGFIVNEHPGSDR